MDQNFPQPKFSAQPVGRARLSGVVTVVRDHLADRLLTLNWFPFSSHVSVGDLISSCAQIAEDFTQPLRGAGDG